MDTRTVKTVRIFLASSSELHDDRVAFADFIMHLKKHYETRDYDFQLEKWEYLNPAYNNQRKQDEYNRVLCNSDSFVALFYTKAGDYTVEEFDVAVNECRKRELPLLIYFKELPADKKPRKLKKLQDRIANELKHFWGTYDTNDKLHLEFALWLDSFLFGNKSELKVEKGEVTMGDVKVADMSELPFAANNKEYQKLEDSIAQLNQEIEQIQQDIKDYPSDIRFAQRLSQKILERDKYQQELEGQQKAFLGAAKRFAEINMQQVSQKLQDAKKAFNEGRLDVANHLLDQIANDAEGHVARLDQERTLVHQDIEALLVQTETVMAEAEKPIKERITRVAKIYAKADDWASRSAYDKDKYAKLLFDYAQFHNKYGHYPEAKQIYLRQIPMSEELYGTNSTDSATSYNEIGLVYKRQGDYDKALEYHFRALAIHEKVLGKEHPSTATSYNNIGVVYDDKGDYDKALEFYFKALHIDEKVLGKEHPDTATDYNNIGLVYKSKGDYDKALEYYFKALDIREKVLGKEHPSTATSYNNIGSVYWNQGDYDKALEYYFKALDIHEKVLGREHPSTATSYNNIGLVYDNKDDYDKALDFYFKALDIVRKVFGEMHPYPASTYNNISLVYMNQGDYDKALEYYFKALGIKEKVLGKEHPSTATSYNNIGLVYMNQGDYDKALEYYEKALAIFLKVFGPDHPKTKTVQRNIDSLMKKLRELGLHLNEEQ